MIFGLAFTFLYSSVVDPTHFDVDPDPGKEIDVDPKRRYKWIRIRPNVVDPGGSGSSMLVYLVQGDGNVRYYELIDDDPYICYLSQFISGTL